MIRVFNPTGTSGATAPFAQRLKTLQGKKIGLLSNGQWQAERMLALLQELLRQEFPTIQSEIIAADEAIQDDKTIDAIVTGGYDAVVVGNAA